MASLTLEIPDEVMVKLKKHSPDVGRELRLAAAFSLCSAGELSTSLAARLAGMTYGEFLEAAARANVMLYSVNIDQLKEEIGRGFTLGRQYVPDHPAKQGGID
jgi:predicted HTH domain antitoxin